MEGSHKTLEGLSSGEPPFIIGLIAYISRLIIGIKTSNIEVGGGGEEWTALKA